MKPPFIERSPAENVNRMKSAPSYRVGQTVWVLGLKDILKTLDNDGKLDGLPFMPEMIPYCGHPFRISTLPNRTCVEATGIFEFDDILFLDGLRCDGSAHDGCQRRCLLYWRGAWLSDKPPTASTDDSTDADAAVKPQLKTRKDERYLCQSTELVGAATARQEDNPRFGKRWGGDIDDLRRGNITHMELLRHILMTISVKLKHLAGIDADRAVYGALQKTRTFSLDLQPGDWVQVKSRKEIEETLDMSGKNTGLLFTPAMLQYCGKRYRVAYRLQKMILEESGKMIQLKNTVVLDGVTCQAWGCQRSIFLYWREIWLKRVEPNA